MATTDFRPSVAHQTRFALRLAAALLSPLNASANSVAFSPLSRLLTASAGGATRDQLAAVLGEGDGPAAAEGLHALAEQVVQLVVADGSPVGGPTVTLANGVFVDASLKLKPALEEVAVGKYKAKTHSVDFKKKFTEVIGQVNSWVEKVTSGLIKELLPPGSLNESTRLVLGNALYFKGAWTDTFDAAETMDDEFHLLDGASVQAPFMTSTEEQYIASYDNFKVLQLCYQTGGDNRQFSMYIFLPEAQNGVWSLAEKLSSESDFLEKHIPMRTVPVGQFKVPKFKISFGFEASDLLKAMGLELPFSKEADLSQLIDSPVEEQNLRASSVYHKSFVQVNEEGTEAASGFHRRSPFPVPN